MGSILSPELEDLESTASIDPAFLVREVPFFGILKGEDAR